ncbi:MAG: hypothetical protein BWY73_00712 [candidate division TA06 bacterium ADurb.Bin417]|uniref:Uncharacterized protein n=1 Tax=candidate division TA06 bacterium ADurb.Bin417 TaxID=1852828 RepID=A0A1V5MHL1_UNCT6|nr:MAG: hypothetical protein BWY73_00712 [candidate division TA06 bacterium ADurb.Bin417]
MKWPTTTQKGSTKPIRKLPRSVTIPKMAAGNREPSCEVKSTKGIGMSMKGLDMVKPVMVGIKT